jgi:hypothetical protein
VIRKDLAPTDTDQLIRMTSMSSRFRILDELGPELVQLQHRQRDLHDHYERVLVRIAVLPNDFEQVGPPSSRTTSTR